MFTDFNCVRFFSLFFSLCPLQPQVRDQSQTEIEPDVVLCHSNTSTPRFLTLYILMLFCAPTENGSLNYPLSQTSLLVIHGGPFKVFSNCCCFYTVLKSPEEEAVVVHRCPDKSALTAKLVGQLCHH